MALHLEPLEFQSLVLILPWECLLIHNLKNFLILSGLQDFLMVQTFGLEMLKPLFRKEKLQFQHVSVQEMIL